MSQVIRAIWDGTAFQPTDRVEFLPGIPVTLRVDADKPPAAAASDLRALAGTLPNLDYSEMITAIEQGCEKIDADEWK